MICIIFVFVICHLSCFKYFSHLILNIFKYTWLKNRRRNTLKDLQDPNLQPRAWRHVIVVIMSMLMHIRKSLDQRASEASILLRTLDLDDSF